MGQEFFIKSDTLEDKIRKTLPSQGGLGQGFDLSASTTIVPIIDLTESAEGSVLRQDLQSSISFSTATAFAVSNANTVIANSTGYWRVFGSYSVLESSGAITTDSFILSDGLSTKVIKAFKRFGSTTITKNLEQYDFIVFLGAGDSLSANSSSTLAFFNGCVRQVADIDGNLVNP